MCYGRRPTADTFSKAKGNKPVSRRVRGLAWNVVAWARAKRPAMIFLENVEEFETWGPIDADGRPIPGKRGTTFRLFVNQLRGLGYVVDWRVLDAADYGAPTHRKRLFLLARCDGRPIEWPEPTHGPQGSQPWRVAGEVIDWSIGTPSIFTRPKPLARKTLERIAHGVVRHVLADPWLAPIEGPDAVAGFFVPRYGERTGQAPRSRELGRPMPTVVPSGNGASLVCAFLTKHYGGVIGHGLDRALGTVTTVDHHALTTAAVGRVGSVDVEAADRVAAFLVKYYGNGSTLPMSGPLHTITTRDRFAMVCVRIRGEDYALTDIGMRMLQPRELARAQGFPDSYRLTGTKTQQTHRIGNSVCPPVVEALCAANA